MREFSDYLPFGFPMVVSLRFLDAARCPLTQSRLAPADEPTLARVNLAIGEGRVKLCDGEPAAHRLEAGLINEDRTVIYPIFEGIVCLLAERAIVLDEAISQSSSHE